MGKQSQAFLEGEGQQWLSRNLDKLPVKDDPVIQAIKDLRLKPQSVLEVGCANGWRMEELRKLYHCYCYGVEPAASLGIRSDGYIWKGTATNLQMFFGERFDVLIYGFCLYLCDPEDYFWIAAEGDRVLKDGGYLIIYDFYESVGEYSVPYEHKEGLFSHHMDFSRLWSWHPSYGLIYEMVVDLHSRVLVLQKDASHTFLVKA